MPYWYAGLHPVRAAYDGKQGLFKMYHPGVLLRLELLIDVWIYGRPSIQRNLSRLRAPSSHDKAVRVFFSTYLSVCLSLCLRVLLSILTNSLPILIYIYPLRANVSHVM